MSKHARQSLTEREEALERLRGWLKPGDTVYTVLRHTSRSKMRHVVSLVKIEPYPEHATGKGARRRNGPVQLRRICLAGTCAQAFGWTFDRNREGIVTDVGGMDFGFDLVYNLSCALLGDGNALRHEWI